LIKKAKVIRIIEKQAIVEILNDIDAETDCSHDCSECKNKNNQFLVDVNMEINEKDIVELYINGYKMFISILLTFILPLLLFTLGLMIGGINNIKGIIFGLLFVAISLIFTYIFDKYFSAKVYISKILERNTR